MCEMEGRGLFPPFYFKMFTFIIIFIDKRIMYEEVRHINNENRSTKRKNTNTRREIQGGEKFHSNSETY